MKHLRSFLKKLHTGEKGDMGLTLVAFAAVFILSIAAGAINDNLSKYTYIKGDKRYIDPTRATEWSNKEPEKASSSEERKVPGGPLLTVYHFWGKSGEPDNTIIRKTFETAKIVNNSSDNVRQDDSDAWGNQYTVDELKDIFEGRDNVDDSRSKERPASFKTDADIGKALGENNLRSDKLNVDIYKTVENLVAESSISNLSADALGNLTAGVLKTIFQNTSPGSSSQTVQAIKSELTGQKALAAQDLIDKRKELKLLQQAKREYELRVAIIDKMLARGESVWAQNLVDYKNDTRIVDELNGKIAAAESAIAALTAKVTVDTNQNTTGNIGAIHVVSTPAGADVWLDGSRLSLQTPRTFYDIAPGNHTVIVKIPGYQDYVRTVKVTTGATAEVSAVLQPLSSATGNLHVVADQKDAIIVIDGTIQDVKTPASFKNVQVGTHTVTVKKAGFKDYSETVTVGPSQVREVWAPLTPLQVSAQNYDGFYDDGMGTPEDSGMYVSGGDVHRRLDYPNGTREEWTGKVDSYGNLSGIWKKLHPGTTKWVTGTFGGNINTYGAMFIEWIGDEGTGYSSPGRFYYYKQK